MGWFFFLALGLPLCALVWGGIAWLLTAIWSDLKVKLAIGRQADEKAKEMLERGFQSARRGY